MPLTDAQKVTVAEIVLETFSVVDGRADLLNADQLLAVEEDIDKWEAIRDSHIKFTGEGVDFDNARKRQAIRERVRKMLGLPLYSIEVVGESGSFALPNIAVF